MSKKSEIHKPNRVYNFLYNGNIERRLLKDSDEDHYYFEGDESNDFLDIIVSVKENIFLANDNSFVFSELDTIKNDNFVAVISKKEFMDTYLDMPKDSSLIVISDPGQEMAAVNYFENELYLSFWNVSIDVSEYEGVSDSQIEDLANFIEININKKFIVVCESGLCVSAGIALAIERIKKLFEIECKTDILSHPRYAPNREIAKSIEDILQVL